MEKSLEECGQTHAKLHLEISRSEFEDLKKLVEQTSYKCRENKDAEVINVRGDALVEELEVIHREQIQQLERYHQQMVSMVKDKVLVERNMQIKWQKDLVSQLTNAKLFIDKAEVQLKDPDNSNKEQADKEDQDVLRQSANLIESLRSVEKSKPAVPQLSCKFAKEDFKKGLTECLQISFSGKDFIVDSVPNYTRAVFDSVSEDYSCKPQGLCVHPENGHVFVSTYSEDGVAVFNESMEKLSDFDGLKIIPFDFAVCGDGNIYISNTASHDIQVIDAEGSDINAFHIQGTGKETFDGPLGIAFDVNDRLYVCDSSKKIVVTDKYGNYIDQFGTSVLFGDRPKFIAVSRDDTVAVTIGGENIKNIHLFTTAGSYISTILGGTLPHNIIYHGVAFDSRGQIVAVDSRGRVIVLTTSGDLIAMVGTYGDKDGQMIQPAGVAIAPNGDIVVADRYNCRIERFKVPFNNL